MVENLRTEVCWLHRALYRRSGSDLVTANHGARCPAKTHTLLSRNHSWYIRSEKIGLTFLTLPKWLFWLTLSSSYLRECIFAILGPPDPRGVSGGVRAGPWNQRFTLVSENGLFLTLGSGTPGAQNENLGRLFNTNIPLN